MIIFLKTKGNGKGDAEIITPEVVYQGSDNVTDITVIAPFSAQTQMSIGFILPNGLYWFAPPIIASDPQSGGNYAPMSFVWQDFTTKANVWRYMLPRSVTEMSGRVHIAINAVTRINSDSNTTAVKGNCTSFLCAFTVSESVVPSLPTGAPTADVYELLRQYLGELDGRTVNVPNLVASIQKVDGNAFTFTDNKGLVSAPITLGEVGYDQTYINAASTLNITDTVSDSSAVGMWTLEDGKYTTTIKAASHGQMSKGVIANDLWVSFDNIENGTLVSADAGYTIAENGDITITVSQPVAMAVRVWNGKGLVDTIARADVAAEVQRAEAAEAQLQANINAEQTRAEAAEQHLQDQIDEIEQSGVDLTARSEIAAEVKRAEAAEQHLQDQIDEIDSYIPSTTSANNKLADQAFVNSSINNMAAFYIESNVNGDAFPTRADLLNATTFYSGGKERVPTQNDYAIVLADESQPKDVDGNYPTTRYSYQGGTYPDGQWGFQYVVNNTSLTQAQVDAINSGITKELVDLIGKGYVLSVNGNTGVVTVTPENIGAVNKQGDTMTGELYITRSSGDAMFRAFRTDTDQMIGFGIGSGGVNRGIWDTGLSKWLFHTDGKKCYVDGYEPYSSNNPPPMYTHSISIITSISSSTYINLPPITMSNDTKINSLAALSGLLSSMGKTDIDHMMPVSGYRTGGTAPVGISYNGSNIYVYFLTSTGTVAVGSILGAGTVTDTVTNS